MPAWVRDPGVWRKVSKIWTMADQPGHEGLPAPQWQQVRRGWIYNGSAWVPVYIQAPPAAGSLGISLSPVNTANGLRYGEFEQGGGTVHVHFAATFTELNSTTPPLLYTSQAAKYTYSLQWYFGTDENNLQLISSGTQLYMDQYGLAIATPYYVRVVVQLRHNPEINQGFSSMLVPGPYTMASQSFITLGSDQ